MRRLLPLSLCLAVFATGCGGDDTTEPASAENILGDFSFAEGAEDLVSGQTPGTDFDISWTNTESFDGGGALKVTSTTLDNQGVGYWKFEILNPTPGSQISLMVRAKASDVEGVGFSVTMGTVTTLDDVATEIVGLENMTSTNNEWQEFSLALNNPIPEGTDSFKIFLLLNRETRGTIYFDALRVMQE